MKKRICRLYTKFEINYIEKNYPIMETIKIAEKLNRSSKSIIEKARKYKIKKKIVVRINSWNERETNFLKKNYLIKSNTEIGRELNKTPVAVHSKLNRLNLKRPYKLFPPEHREKIIDSAIKLRIKIEKLNIYKLQKVLFKQCLRMKY